VSPQLGRRVRDLGHAAAKNKGALDYHTRVLNKPAYSFRPIATTTGLDFVAFGGLAFGLLGMTAGLVRMRNEKKSPFYRVGTARASSSRSRPRRRRTSPGRAVGR